MISDRQLNIDIDVAHHTVIGVVGIFGIKKGDAYG